MRAYWYWPFVRAEELALAEAFASLDNVLTVHTISGRLEPQRNQTFGVRDDIPALKSRAEGTLGWLASRATAYPRRAVLRNQIARSSEFDIAHLIYLNYFTDGLALRLLRRNIPTVVTVHDVIPHESRVPERLERVLLGMQYAAAPNVIVHHVSVGERLHREFGYPLDRIHNVPWAVPDVVAEPKSTPSPIPTILLFGTLRRNKGVDVLLAAFEQLSDFRARLVVAGRGFADVEQLVRDAARRDNRIEAELGFVTEQRKHELYREADLVVLPYTSFSSQSAVLHDAYAHHRPVVVSDVGALGDAVREDGSGWVTLPGDAEMLADILRSALGDASSWLKYSTGAATTAAQRTPTAVAARLDQVYREILGEPKLLR